MCHHQCRSALRESNPPVQLGRLMPLPIGQEHKAEGEGVEPSRPGTREVGGSTVFETVAIAHWLALPYSQSCGGRNRTCEGALNRRLPVPTQAPPQNRVRVAGFEPAISSSLSLRDARLRYTLASLRGRIRTTDLVLPKHAGFQATPRTE